MSRCLGAGKVPESEAWNWESIGYTDLASRTPRYAFLILQEATTGLPEGKDYYSLCVSAGRVPESEAWSEYRPY